jgi:hypothetical protein
MPSTQLIYVSTAARRHDRDVLQAFLDVSVRHNARQEDTGMLPDADACFTRVQEGDGAAVDETMASLRKDERDHDIVVLEQVAIQERKFGDGSMGSRALGAMNRQGAFFCVRRVRPIRRRHGQSGMQRAGHAEAFSLHQQPGVVWPGPGFGGLHECAPGTRLDALHAGTVGHPRGRGRGPRSDSGLSARVGTGCCPARGSSGGLSPRVSSGCRRRTGCVRQAFGQGDDGASRNIKAAIVRPLRSRTGQCSLVRADGMKIASSLVSDRLRRFHVPDFAALERASAQWERVATAPKAAGQYAATMSR